MAKKKSSAPATGYSGTPLPKKLGIAAGDVVALHGAPPHYLSLLGELPPGVTFRDGGAGATRLAHFFTASRAALAKALPKLGKSVFPDGRLWISWPKKGRLHPTKRRDGDSKLERDPTAASRVNRPSPGDLDENGVRELALPLGLVDVKVCAIDADWSGLLLMWRKERR